MNSPKQQKIPIVDNIVEYALAFKMYLPDNAEVLVAVSDEQARGLIADHPRFDLAIIDVCMAGRHPDDDGEADILSRIGEHYSPGTPVILTGAAQAEKLEPGKDFPGRIQFLRKPLHPDEIRKAFHAVLSSGKNPGVWEKLFRKPVCEAES